MAGRRDRGSRRGSRRVVIAAAAVTDAVQARETATAEDEAADALTRACSTDHATLARVADALRRQLVAADRAAWDQSS
jgi:hypothetical protein